MDEEDGEASNNDSWTPEQLSYKETSLPENLNRLNPENDCYDGEIVSEDRQIPRGSKNNYFPDNESRNKVSADSGKSKDVTEYAQCLGLQPAGKYKCATCRPTVTFYSLSMLKQHQFVCQAANSTPGPSDHHQHVSFKRYYKSSSSSSSSSSLVKNNFRITRKVYLCSACGTYFENWNLFLHMRETHKRHICLFCLGMFGQAERLSNHLIKKHSVQVENFNNIDNFYDIFKGSCYLLCCDCEKVFSETDNFSEHNCLSVHISELKEIQNVVDQPELVSLNHQEEEEEQQQQQQQQPVSQIQQQQPQQPIINDQVNVSPSKLGYNQDRHERINNKRTLLPNPANKVAKKLLSEKAKFKNDFYQTKLANLYSRKRIYEEEEEEEEQEDIEGDYSVNNYFKNSDVSDKTRITEVDITNSPEKSDRYTDTIMQVSRCSDDWDSDDKEDDTVNSLDEMEQGELILDDGKEDSVESLPSPIREVSPIRSPVRELTPSPEKRETTTETSATTEESPVKEPAATCTRVNSRSLVIKICTNKNSQFSIATPNSNGTYTESGDEAKDSDKETDSSDSDTGKLTVALPEPENQKSPELEQEPELETKETEAPEELPEEILNQSQEKSLEIHQNDDQNDDVDVEENQMIPDDGILLASSDAPSIDLNVVGLLESMEIDELLKLCIEAASPTCVYCNHARHIAINGKQLALHMLAEHRFQPQHPAIIIQREQFTNRVKKSLDELESFYFNFDSYDSKRGTYAFPEVRTYECYLCRIYFTIHKDLYLHNRKSHQKTILVCIMCKSSFFNHSELLCHLCPGVYAAGGTLRYRCCMCSIESLPSSFRLMVHLRKRHDTCDVCLESTGNQQKLSNHVWKHKLHHLCYRCGIAYRNKPDITKHLFWKHGTESVVCKKCLQKKWPHVYHFCIPPSEFICEECGANFTRAVALKVHKRLHTGDAPYGCNECPDKFISKKLAAKHEESHKQPEIPPAPDPEPENDKISDNKEPEQDEVAKEQPIRKVVDVYDLPPLNLSSDSDSDEDDRVEDKGKSKEDDKERIDEENKEIDETRIEINEVPEEIQLSEANDEADEVNKQEVVIMNGIWDNFKSYAASLGSDLTPEVELKASNDEILKNIAAEHDYWVVYEPPKDEIQEEREQVLEDKKKKSPKKKKSGSDSSSDSSSDSDSSSCSCGTNCSCSSSSSGSSSSSSSSSDSDSSTESHKQSRKDRRKEREAKRKKEDQVPERENGICEEVNEENLGNNLEVQDPPREALPVRESDLETIETETDEDFYDENPQQHASKLAERKSQSVIQEPVPPDGAEVKNGVIEPVESQVNSLPVKSKPSLKRKIKTKRRKKLETREARENVRGRGRGRPPGSTKGTLKLNIPKNILFQKKNPSPPTFNTIDEFMYHTNYQVTESTFNSSAMSATSENETSANDSKRSSKRKRIPKKFYGDSSDEEHQRNPTKWQRPNTTIPYVPSITIKQNFGPPPPSVNKAYSQEPPLQPAVIVQPVETPAPVSVHAAVNVTTDSEPADSSSDSSSEEETNTRATHPPINNLGAIGSSNVYCYCRCPYDEVSEMIACDGNNCRIEWFHFECVGIMVPPKGKWYCPDCLKRDGLADDDDDDDQHDQ